MPRRELPGANRSALHFLMAVQMAMIQEMLFAGFEMFDRTRTEMHLLDEFSSKIASAHSVGNINDDVGRMHVTISSIICVATPSGCSGMVTR